MKLRVGKTRILSFDIENRPLSYLGGDFTTAEITAIAAKTLGHGPMRVWLLGIDDPLAMFEEFRVMYDEAGLVTGHYIRKHDLRMLNGMMLEAGLRPLSPKMAQDTCLDLFPLSGISKSQENLSGTLGVPAGKVHMSTPRWRSANRLEPEGIELTRRRAAGDVRQNIQLRARLLELGWLRPPRMWRPR